MPLTSTTATACADALVAGCISRFGVPAAITTDRGVQFTSAVWQVLCRRLGIIHITTTAYHPQANSLVERFHCQLKDSMRARLTASAWPSHLPWVLLTSSCRLVAVKTRCLWTGSNHAWPQKWIQRLLPAVAVLHTTLNNLVLRPPFWGGPCGYREILQPGPGEIRQRYYNYPPVCSRHCYCEYIY